MEVALFVKRLNRFFDRGVKHEHNRYADVKGGQRQKKQNVDGFPRFEASLLIFPPGTNSVWYRGHTELLSGLTYRNKRGIKRFHHIKTKGYLD